MSDKKSILILFKERKKETPTSFFYERKFSKEYNVNTVFISDYLMDNSFKIIKKINNIIKEERISVALFEGDHLSIFDTKFIKSIDNSVKKGIFLQDDYMFHYTNRITASECDFVLTACPLSDLKFKELGYNSIFLPVEADGSIFKDYNEKKIYDVLFFGRVKNNRSQMVKFLKENAINIMECGPYDPISNTPEKLAKLINKSKIVLNFSESDNKNRENNSLSYYRYYYQMKGRVCFIGMCNSLCLSEYSPSNELIFNNNEIPYFKNKEDCLKIIQKLIKDDLILRKTTEKYREKCLYFEDSNYMKKIKNFFETLNLNKKVKVEIPYWYEYAFFKKNIMLRFRQNKFISFFSQIFISIFLTNYKTKYLIPIFFSLGVFVSILFIIKFPLQKLKS